MIKTLIPNLNYPNLIEKAFSDLAVQSDFPLLRIGRRFQSAYELVRRGQQIAGHLMTSDTESTVIVTAVDPFDAAAALIGAIYAQRPVALINPKLTKAERNAQMSLIKKSIIINDERAAAWQAKTQMDAPLRQLSQLPDAKPGIIVFTAGSSGEPKAILHSYASMSAILKCTYDLYPSGIDLIAMPMHSLGGIQTLLNNLLKRCSLVLPVSAKHEAFVAAALDAEPATILCFPSYAEALLDNSIFVETNKIETIHTGGEKMSAELRDRLIRDLNCAILPAYGLAEYGPISVSRDSSPEKRDMLGDILPDVEFQLSSLGDEAGLDEVGELMVRGASLMLGYLLPPKGIFEAASPWFATGDVLKIVGTNEYRHLGRKSDLVEADGFYFALSDLERHLTMLDIVTDAVAVKYVKAEKEEIAVFIKTVASTPITEVYSIVMTQIDDFCAGLVAREDLEVMRELPLNAAPYKSEKTGCYATPGKPVTVIPHTLSLAPIILAVSVVTFLMPLDTWP